MNPVQRIRFKFLLERINAGTYTGNDINASGYGLGNREAKLLLNAIKASKKLSSKEKISLDLSNNSQLTSLEIDGIANLYSFQANGSGLKHLTLKNLPILARLSVEGCMLSAIDLSSVRTLESLNVSSNLIRVLDIANFKSLKTAYVQQRSMVSLFITGSPLSSKFAYDSTNLDPVSLIQVIAHQKARPEQTIDYFNLVEGRDDDVVLTNEHLAKYLATTIKTYKESVAHLALGESAKMFAYLTAARTKPKLPTELTLKTVISEVFLDITRQYIMPAMLAALNSAMSPEREKLIRTFIAAEVPQVLNHLSKQATTQLHKTMNNSNSALTRVTNRLSGQFVESAIVVVNPVKAPTLMRRGRMLFSSIAKNMVPVAKNNKDKVVKKSGALKVY